MAQKTDPALDALIQKYGSADAVAKAARARGTQSTKDFFIANLPDAGVTLAVGNWIAFKLFLAAPNANGQNVQSLYEDLHSDVEDAIAAKDADALIQSLLLLYKAVKRG